MPHLCLPRHLCFSAHEQWTNFHRFNSRSTFQGLSLDYQPQSCSGNRGQRPTRQTRGDVGVGIFTVCETERFGGKQTKEFHSPPLEKTPPVLTGPLWWLQPLLEVELWPSIGQEPKWPTAPPQERALSPTRYYKQPPNLKSLLFHYTDDPTRTSPGSCRRSICKREHSQTFVTFIFSFKFIFLQRFYFELRTFIFTRPRYSLPLAGRAHRLFLYLNHVLTAPQLFHSYCLYLQKGKSCHKEKRNTLFNSEPARTPLPQSNQRSRHLELSDTRRRKESSLNRTQPSPLPHTNQPAAPLRSRSIRSQE